MSEVETNVRVPGSALASLSKIQQRRGIRSRAQTLRQVLENYVAAQMRREPDERLTHVATLMRYPRSKRRLKGGDHGGTLRLRVESELLESARSHAFRLPGQSVHRGHFEYQARPLTDAILTGISLLQRIDDPVLGRVQLLTRRQARGLWRLAVDATSTVPEQALYDQHAAWIEECELAGVRGEAAPAATPEQRRASQVVGHLDKDVAWFFYGRYDLVEEIVGTFFTRRGARQLLPLLEARAAGYRDSDEWLDMVDEVRRAFLSATSGRTRAGLEGRGGTAIWRAERIIDGEAVIRWLASTVHNDQPRDFVVQQPGWRLRLPSGWKPVCFPSSGPLPQLWAEHAAAGRVLHLHHGGQQVLWPARQPGLGQPLSPVPGFDELLDAAKGWSAVDIVETLLLERDLTDEQAAAGEVPWWANMEEDKDYLDRHDFRRQLLTRVPAALALEFGLIDRGKRDAIIARAKKRGHGVNHVDCELALFEIEGVCDKTTRDGLYASLADVRKVMRTLASIDGDRYRRDGISEPETVWFMASLAELIDNGLPAEQVRWLVPHQLHKHHLALMASMRHAWDRAFHGVPSRKRAADVAVAPFVPPDKLPPPDRPAQENFWGAAADARVRDSVVDPF